MPAGPWQPDREERALEATVGLNYASCSGGAPPGAWGTHVYEPQTATTNPGEDQALEALARHVMPRALLNVNRAHDRETAFDKRA